MRPIRSLTPLAAALSLTALLSACGGGGGGSTAPGASSGGSGGNSPTASTIPPGTQTTPTYAAGSTEGAMFAQLNAYRQQCGFPPVLQNTLLDQSAANHAQYMVLNGKTTTDTEVQGNPGFTGVTFQDRAMAVGWPLPYGIGGGTTAWYNYDNTTQQSNVLTPTQMGQLLINRFASGVYHQGLIAWPYQYVGVGVANTTNQGLPLTLNALAIGGFGSLPASSTPLTFPCQGVKVMFYGSNHENPVPPNSSSSGFGTPVAVVGNVGDQVQITAASITGPQGSVQVNILNSNTDPNKLVPAYQASVYPTSPLQPNTAYQVLIEGTINGNAFTRQFSFSTGNMMD